MKEIWLICKYASPEIYGGGSRHFFLSEEWIKHDFTVTVFTSNSNHLNNSLPSLQEKYDLNYYNGVLSVMFNCVRSKKSFSVWRVISWIQFEFRLFMFDKRKLKPPDIVLVSSLSLLSIITGLFYAWYYKANFVLEIRDIWPLTLIEVGKLKKYNPFIQLLASIEKLGYKKADIIVGTMPNLGEHVASVLGHRKPVYCIPQGITLKSYLELSKPSASVLNLGLLDSFKIVYTGTLNLNNPIDELLEALDDTFLEKYNIEIIIVGAGDRLNLLSNRYKSTRIHFLGYFPKQDIKNILAIANLAYDCIIPGVGRYGMSRYKWIDYMCAGLPILCSFTGFPSILNEAHCGFFVEYGCHSLLRSKILEVLLLPKGDLKRIGLNGRDFIFKQRLFSKLACDYIHLFNDLKTR